MLNFKQYQTSKKQGDVGVAVASMYATMCGFTVSFPFSDSQPYDVIFDIGGKLKKIQVKTTSHKAKRKTKVTYVAELCTSGGTAGTDKTYFDPTKVDFVFVVCDNGDCYFMPSKKITTRTALSLSVYMDEYKVMTIKDLKPTFSTAGNGNSNNKDQSKNCIDCNAPISKQAERCKSCAAYNCKKFTVNWPDSDTLLEMIKNSSYSAVGHELGCTDNAVRKHLQNYPPSRSCA
jgi:PD-(D/E)XK endonuclease